MAPLFTKTTSILVKTLAEINREMVKWEPQFILQNRATVDYLLVK